VHAIAPIECLQVLPHLAFGLLYVLLGLAPLHSQLLQLRVDYLLLYVKATHIYIGY